MDLSLAAEILKGFFTGAVKDMKTIPHTALSAFLLWITIWTLVILWWWLVYPKITVAAEAVPKVQQLDNSMQALQATLIVDKWERQLASMRSRIFALQQEIAATKAKRLVVPYSTLEQLDDLTEQRRSLEQKLTNYTLKYSDLLEPKL